MDIEVNRCTFGIIQRKGYYIHNEIIPEKCSEHKKAYSDWPPTWEKYMNTNRFHVFLLDCLHDKKYLQVRIPMIDRADRVRRRIRKEYGLNQGGTRMFPREIDKMPEGPPGDRNLYNEISVKMIYDNVMKLTIDIHSTEKILNVEYINATLYIHYRHCPSVYIRKNDERKSISGRWFRYIIWSEDFTIENFLNDMTESSVMGITIRCTQPEFTMLLYQLQDLIHCKLEFTRYNEYNPPDYVKFPSLFFEWPFEIKYLIAAVLSNGYAGKYALLRSQEVMSRMVESIEDHLFSGKTDKLKQGLLKLFFEVIQDTEIVDNILQIQHYSRVRGLQDDSFEDIRKVCGFFF